MLIRSEPDKIRIMPAVFKFSGEYPKDFDPEKVTAAGAETAAGGQGGSRRKPVRRTYTDPPRGGEMPKTGERTEAGKNAKGRRTTGSRKKQSHDEMEGQLSLFLSEE